MMIHKPAALIASLALALLLVATPAERAEARRGWGWVGAGIAAAVIIGSIHNHRRYYRRPYYGYYGGYGYQDYDYGYYRPYYYPRRHLTGTTATVPVSPARSCGAAITDQDKRWQLTEARRRATESASARRGYRVELGTRSDQLSVRTLFSIDDRFAANPSRLNK